MEQLDKSIFAQINSEYADIRKANREKHEALLSSIYASVPRVEQIQKELQQLGLSATKRILQGEDSDLILNDMKQQMDSLNQEKAALLASFGLTPAALEEIYTCPVCKDTGHTPDGRCQCFRDKLSRHMQKMSNVCTSGNNSFDNFNLNLYSDRAEKRYGISPRENMQSVLALAKAFAQGGGPDNMLFYGGNGLGKTFTSDCIAKEFLDSSKTVFYMSAPRLFTLFEDYKFGRSTSPDVREAMSAVFDSSLLIIDDLGTEFKTAYVESILFEIINSRLNSGRRTIISTNLHPQQFAQKYNCQISSRILGCFEKVLFFGDDIRLNS